MIALVLTLCAGTSWAGTVREALVYSDRVVVGDLVSNATASVARLDMGPAPRPGQSRIVTGVQIRGRLNQAMLPYHGLSIPGEVRVVRPAQRLNELELQSLLAERLASHLPQDSAVTRVDVRGGLLLAQGEITVRFEPSVALRRGRNSLRALVGAGQSQPVAVPLTVYVDAPELPATVVMRRGDFITVIARSGAVEVRGQGVVQKDAQRGEVVPVLPTFSSKILHGRVADAKTVEVEL